MARSLTTQIEDALELLLYAERYRDSLLVIVLEPGLTVREIVDALRVFELAHIRCIVITENYEGLQQEASTLSRRGVTLSYYPYGLDHGEDLDPGQKAPTAQPLEIPFIEDTIPVVAFAPGEDFPSLCQNVFTLLSPLEIRKLFLCFQDEAPLLHRFSKPLLTTPELEQLLREQNFSATEGKMIRLLQQEVRENQREVVLLRGASGSLFQEVFTHLGCGTMITATPPNRARVAELSDVLAISNLMKPYTQEGSILPLTEDAIAARVKEFLVYTVNEAIVGAARLTPYESCGELGSICTLPRYRGQGLAREIAAAIFTEAESRRYDMVFSLSTSPAMWEFFLSLGMEPIERERLPELWKSRYDFARPSRAFTKRLPTC